MFKNDYFDVEKLVDDSVLIMDKDGKPYKWGEGAVTCFCPAYKSEVSPFLLVKYGDNTWSLCHAEAGPMPEATHVPEKECGECPIIFQEDFLEDKKQDEPQRGCLKTSLIGLLSLGAMLIGVDTVFQKCSPIQECKIPQKTQETVKFKNVKDGKISLKADTCMIIKAQVHKMMKDAITYFNTRR